MNITRVLAALVFVASVGCSDDDDPDTNPLDGGVDSGARDAALDAQGLDATTDALVSCGDGGFNNGVGCRPWTTCPRGTYLSAPGTATADQQCTACLDGTYTDRENAPSCTPLGQLPDSGI